MTAEQITLYAGARVAVSTDSRLLGIGDVRLQTWSGAGETGLTARVERGRYKGISAWAGTRSLDPASTAALADDLVAQLEGGVNRQIDREAFARALL